ncbi:MAG: DUF5915 domain-containing protein, partial [Gemmataceae bacterium]|nr:DUF5915 domain-containing protein [Gemmataceae bacterium]
NHDRAYWEKWFPADFITESFPGQFRNWFYAILAMSTMMVNRPPFKVLLGHALVRDEHGNTMSKSLGNAIEFNEAADKMGADVMRWLYCRSNPALNINFGYGPADELRSKFVIKLWNTYAFFCNYARLDGFDPAAPPVPIRERPDIDRWILSDLQLLIQTAHREFRRYNVQAFCLEAEKFVDDKLSNWYVRRNRRRFWKSEQGTDKQAAYQTLYTVLMTLSRLFAPVMPFVTEAMYQNLRAGNPKENVSVHLCDYPQADEALIDRELSADMEAVLQVVSLGSAARNSVKIKVRQPLAELVVQGPPRVRSAVERFADQIAEELNIKRVRLHDAAGALLQPDIKPNLKALGPKHGNRLHEVRAAIEEYVRSGRGVPEKLECPGGAVVLEPGDLVVEKKAPPGWAGAADKEIEVLIDARITPELKREGLAREVIRQVQQARKNAGLEMEDRIELHLGPEAAELRQAIEAHRDYIATETLTSIWKGTPLAGEAYRERVQVDGHALPIELRKVPTPTA